MIEYELIDSLILKLKIFLRNPSSKKLKQNIIAESKEKEM
jgi:hypothetical protein